MFAVIGCYNDCNRLQIIRFWSALVVN